MPTGMAQEASPTAMEIPPSLTPTGTPSDVPSPTVTAPLASTPPATPTTTDIPTNTRIHLHTPPRSRRQIPRPRSRLQPPPRPVRLRSSRALQQRAWRRLPHRMSRSPIETQESSKTVEPSATAPKTMAPAPSVTAFGTAVIPESGAVVMRMETTDGRDLPDELQACVESDRRALGELAGTQPMALAPQVAPASPSSMCYWAYLR